MTLLWDTQTAFRKSLLDKELGTQAQCLTGSIPGLGFRNSLRWQEDDLV